MTRVVLDTNIIISAVFWAGKPYEVMRKGLVGEYQPVTSPEIVEEVVEKLRNKFNFPEDKIQEQGGVAHRWAREGKGCIVVEGVSRYGWIVLCDAVGRLSPEDQSKRGSLMDALVAEPYITWDTPHQDVGRLNAMAAAEREAA